MFDRHHIQWTRANYMRLPETRRLRQQPGLIPTIYRDVHEDIHSECEPVPALSRKMASKVLEIYQDYPDNNLRSIDNYLLSVDKAIDKLDEQDRYIGQLAIMAIEKQIPYIAYGLRDSRKISVYVDSREKKAI